jgi:membrane protease subunit HflC
VQALITEFGQIQGKPITKAGLRFKLPYQDVRYFDKRILTWDGDIEQIPTKDKKYIWVDTTARWKIIEVRKFAESVVSEREARARLDGILDGATRDTISSHNLVEAVRNSNSIIQDAAKSAEAAKELGLDPEEVMAEIEKISVGREKLSKFIMDNASAQLAKLGIQLIDVQIRRIAYEKSVEKKVYDRMVSERERIAERIRSFGKGEEAKIRGKLNRDLKQIESDAYRVSQEIKGKAEGEAIKIYALSMKQDPSYYEFKRTLEVYQKSLAKGSFILSTDSQFLKLLNKAN